MHKVPVRAVPLAVQVIPNVSRDLAAKLELPPHIRSLGLLTATIDDVGYTAVDEATKKAKVEVVYAKSFYAGLADASGPLSGEFLGILGGESPSEVTSGLEAAVALMNDDCCFMRWTGIHPMPILPMLYPAPAPICPPLREFRRANPSRI